MFPFIFQIEGYHFEDPRQGTFKQGGVIYAKSWTDAVSRIEDYYGEEELVAIDFLMPMESGPVIMPIEAIESLKKGEWDVDTYIE